MEKKDTAQTSRRSFVQGMGIAAASVVAASVAPLGAQAVEAGETRHEKTDTEAAIAVQDADVVTGSDSETILNRVENATGGDHTYIPRVDELATPKMPAPEVTDYECDVLVVGGGLSGLNAAYAAAQAGLAVILVDKGTPGYSGLSAWPSCTAYYDPERDIDMEHYHRFMQNSCDCFANLTWDDVWCEESKATFDRLQEWGWINQYARGVDAGYWVDGNMFHDDVKGYFQHFAEYDRRKVFGRVLEENGVTVVDHVMIADVIECEGRIVGAVGLHYKSATPITFRAKAVVLATGNGVIKSSGYPVGADTYDGIWMGYQHGLPITGLEFEDFHFTTGYASGNALYCNSWQYVENIWPTGPTVTVDNLTSVAPFVPKRYSTFLDGFARNDTAYVEDIAGKCASVASKNGDDSDPRKGKWTSPLPHGDVYGAAVGMSTHTCAGIWCGVDDTDCFTGLEGLYATGDGTNGNYMGGSCYGSPRGSTSCFMSLQGYHAGSAAAAYAAGVEGCAELPVDEVQAVIEQMLAPAAIEKGYDPTWVRDTLNGIMAPGWVILCKSEETLAAARTQVRTLRSLVTGRMKAENNHDLRLAMENEHLLLAMELKLNAGIERRESRGYHYRTDYPFRDDNYLYYITQTKGADGEPVLGRAELKEEWKGDLTEDYPTRYPMLTTPEEKAKYCKE